jgi:hypothetical protein
VYRSISTFGRDETQSNSTVFADHQLDLWHNPASKCWVTLVAKPGSRPISKEQTLVEIEKLDRRFNQQQPPVNSQCFPPYHGNDRLLIDAG